MDPIAEYRERMLQVSRRFELYPDRVEIEARWVLRGRYRTTVHLAGLNPQPNAFFIRNKLFKWSLTVLVVGMLVVFLSGDVERLRAWEPFPVAGVATTFAGVIFCWMTSRRIRFAKFDSRAGGPGLDVGCTGPDKPRFEAFLSQVQRQIRKANRLPNSKSPPA